MANWVDCRNCGAGVTLPSGYARAKIRCPGCGHYAEVPLELRGQEGVENVVSPAPPVTATRPGRAESVTAKRAAPDEQPLPPPSPRNDDDEYDGESKYSFAEPLPPPPPPLTPHPTPAGSRKPREARPQADPRDFRAKFEPDNPEFPEGEPLLKGTREESDDEALPYTVPGTGLKKCPECRGELPLDSSLCVHCGFDLGTGKKAGRVFQPITAEWHEGWTPLLRIQIFVGLQVVNLLAAILLIATGGATFDFAGVVTLVLTQAFQIGLQAFLIGTYDTLQVKRTAKGSATVYRVRRIAFYKTPPVKVPWKKSTNVGIAGADTGLFPKLLCLYFFLNAFFYGVSALYSCFMLGLSAIYLAVAVGFYWVVVRPSRFEVILCDVYGATDEVVFRCEDREQADEVCHIIAEATGLTYRKVV